MTAIYIQNAIKSKNDHSRLESPRLDDFNITTGEGYSTVTNKCSEDDVDALKPKGRTSIENGTTSHRLAKERVRIGTWNVRTLHTINLEVVKREMEKTGVDLLGISEMKWTGIGHFTSDEHEIYYCGHETLKRNGVEFIVIINSEDV